MTRGHQQTNRWFAQFCRTGDPAALGAVFDRTAAELLHVAVWLCGNRTDAEDLLQRTFVQAIEARAQFEPGRPVLPWLTGILANHARHLRRERARVLPERAAVGERDPAAAASEAEFAAAVQQRVEAIEAPYREVLQLHLEQGLNARQIGERLQRPAGTVRTQLVRALGLLRKKLPSGFVASVAAVALPDAARVVAVKAAVMAAAKSAAPTTAAVTTGALVTGGVLMGKKVLLVSTLLLLLLGSAGFLLYLPDRAESQAPAPGITASAGPVAAPDPAPVAAQRQEIAIPSPSAPVTAHGSLVVHVHWDTTAPAAAMPVFVSFGILQAPLLDRLQATTDSRGRGVFEHLRPGTWWVQPLVGEAVSAHVARDDTTEIAITVTASATLHGKVIDPDQRPVADAEIWTTGPDSVHDAAVAAHSDADGAFELPVSRAVFVGARKRGSAPSCMFFFYPQSKLTEVTLQLREAASRLHGVVQDASGAPVAQARVRVGDVSPSVRSGFNPASENEPRGIDVVSDARGHFTVDDLPAGTTPLNAWAEGYAAAQQWVKLVSRATGECTVVLLAEASVRGVVRGPDGRPVAGALVEYGDNYSFDRVVARSGPAGEYQLNGLPRSVVVSARDDDGRRDSRRLYLPADKPGAWDPRLGIGGEIAGRVMDVTGHPCTTARVTCSGETSGTTASTEVDAEGRFRFSGLASGPQSLGVWVGHAFVRHMCKVQPGTLDVVIQLAADETPSVRLHLRTVDADRRPRGGVVQVMRSDGSFLPGGESARGEFELGPLPPGTLALSLSCGDVGSDWVFPLTTVTLAAGETRDLGEFFVPAAGRVRVSTVDAKGKALRVQTCTLFTPDGQRVAHFDGAEGAAPPGRWLLFVLAADDERHTTPDGGSMIDVLANQTTEGTVTVHTGAAASFCLSALDPQLGGMSRLLVRDDAGVLVLVDHAYLPGTSRPVHSLKAGRYVAEAFGPGPLRGTVEFVLVDGDRKSVPIPVR